MTKWKSAFAAVSLLSATALAGCEGSVEVPQKGSLVDDGTGAGTGTKPGAGPAKPGVGGATDDGVGGADTPDAPSSGIGSKVFGLCESEQEQPGPRLLRLLTRREFQNTIQDLLFLQKPDVTNLPQESRVRGFDNNATAAVVTSRHLDEYLSASDGYITKALAEKKGQLLTCQPTAAGCAKMFVEKFGMRAFRRPLSADEIARYEKLFAAELTEGDFDQGLRLAISAMIVSPNFLYRSEVGDKQGDGTFKLTQYEVASALSYLYWGTMPDQALFDAAAKNELGSKAQLETQARRLLGDQRAKDQLAEFSMQWLRSDNVVAAFKDKMIYPSFSDGLRTAMIEEQKRFIVDIVLTRDGKFDELYGADYVWANGELARFYGLNGGSNDFQKVMAPKESGRGGILGLGAVLAAHAHSNESSPIKRGLFVRDRLLCQDLSPPPANLDTTPPGLDPTLTTRVRFQKHTADTSCSGCHQFIDGVGFGFEGFDGVGQKRTQENGMPIDESGEIRSLEQLGDKDSTKFVGLKELASLLGSSASAKGCLTLQYYRYGRGYAETERDACSVSKLQTAFENKNLTIKELLVNLALLDSFTVRGAG